MVVMFRRPLSSTRICVETVLNALGFCVLADARTKRGKEDNCHEE
jgi:hypothetical protein